MGIHHEPTWREDLTYSALSIVILAMAPVICAATTIFCLVWIGSELCRKHPRPRVILHQCAGFCVGTVSLPLAVTAETLPRLFYRPSRLACEIMRDESTELGRSKKNEDKYWRGEKKGVRSGTFGPYSYPKLRGDHDFRLFEIQPGGKHDDHVQGRIIRTNLFWRPSYDAISYTWADEKGDAAETEKVYLPGQLSTVTVTSNCVTVLKQLRHQRRRRRVWIDAICIDQQSDLDRTQQVSLMATIYTSARKVIAYTGEATEESDKLFDWMNSIHPKDLVLPTNSGWAGFLDTEGQEWAPRTGQLMAGLDQFWYHLSVLGHKASFFCSQWWPGQAPADRTMSLSDQQVMDAATEYFSRRWFQRVWILQEVSLPDLRRVVIQCGAKSTSALRALHSLSLLPTGSDGPGALALGRFYLMLGRKITRPGKSHLLDVLIETRDRYCSEPRDKIFGVLSIANRLDEGRFPELVANYDLSMAQVYVSYSKFFIHQHGLAFFWCLIKSSSVVPNLPSWAADWSVPWPNYKAVRGRHLPATSRNNDRLGPFARFENDFDGRELLKVIRPTVVRGVFTKDGHLDGSNTTTRTIEKVGNLEEGHHLVELYPGICALLRESGAHHEFIQVCPHHLKVDGLHRVVDDWAEYVVDGKISDVGDTVGDVEGRGYLSGLRTYLIR